MNEPGDIPLTNSDTPDTKPCSLISIIPTIGMSSCRGRAEAFARSLSSKLRTLGSQTDDDKDMPEDEPIINGLNKNTWIPSGDTDMVTELQPGRHETDTFFDYDCDMESPGSPVDECEYLRLIETASNTPHNSVPETGFACCSASSHSSNDGQCSTTNTNYGNDTTDGGSVVTTLPKSIMMNSINMSDYTNYMNSVLKPNNNSENQINNEINTPQHPNSNSNSNQNQGTTPTTPATTPTNSSCESIESKFSNNFNTKNMNMNVNGNNNVNSGNNGVKLTTKQTFPLNNTKGFPTKEEDMIKIQNDILRELHHHSSSLKAEEKLKAIQENGKNGEKEYDEKPLENGEISENGENIENDKNLKHYENGEKAENGEIGENVENLKNGEYQQHNENGDLLKENQFCEYSGQNGEETLSVRGDDNHTTYTFHHSITNGQQSFDRDEVLKIEVTTEENQGGCHGIYGKTNDLTNGGQLKVEITTQCNENSLLLITNQQREESPQQNDQDENKENVNHININGKIISKSNSNNQVTETTDDDEEDCRPQRVRRCSSLKTGKTPPGTPGRKKIVRFADVLGLDLADVKTFLDEIPTIPKSAFMDLEIMENEPPLQLGPRSDKLLMPLFQQPACLPTFLDIVREKQVSLENASVTDVLNQTITGTVRVRNLDFHKSVYIRYTLDNWRSFAELQANYVPNSCDGFSDKFSFIIFGNSLQIGQRLEFAVRFQCKGQQFWDNNYGTNYCFQCLAAGNPLATTVTSFVPATHPVSNVVGLLSPTAGDAWCNSFY